jgi:hypothetical protein
MEAFMTGWLGEVSLGWLVLMVLWLVLLAYRAWLASREEDQLFLASDHVPGASEQTEIVGKLAKLTKPIWILGVLTGAMTVTVLGLWLWQGMNQHV